MKIKSGWWRTRYQQISARMWCIAGCFAIGISLPLTAQITGIQPIFDFLPPAPFGNIPGILISWEPIGCDAEIEMIAIKNGHRYSTKWKRVSPAGSAIANFVPSSGAPYIISDDKKYKWGEAGITVHCILLQYNIPPIVTQSWVVAGEKQFESTGDEYLVAPPKPKIKLSAAGKQGPDISVPVAPGAALAVSLDGTESTTDDPSIAIVSYSWKAGEASIADGATASYPVSANTSFTLTVTDESGQSASQTGSVTVCSTVVATTSVPRRRPGFVSLSTNSPANQCGDSTNLPAPPAGNGGGPNCITYYPVLWYTDGSFDVIGPAYQVCSSATTIRTVPTAGPTLTLPDTNTDCSSAAWFSSNSSVAVVNTRTGRASTMGSGQAYLQSVCPTRIAVTPVTVTSWSTPSPTPTPTCRTYYFMHAPADGHWMDVGQKCLDSASAISPSGLMAMNPLTDAIQPAMPLSQAQSTCIAAQNVCWLGFYADDQYLRSGAYFDCPQLSHIGGDASAYPVTVTYRVNGQVVQTTTGVDAAHFPQPPATCHATAPSDGWTSGDIVAVSATLTDARGVTLTAGTWVGWPPDDGGESAPVPTDGAITANSRAKANSAVGPSQASDAARIMARQAELRARAGIHLQPWEIRSNWQHGQP
jgi:hypothetical protein